MVSSTVWLAGQRPSGHGSLIGRTRLGSGRHNAPSGERQVPPSEGLETGVSGGALGWAFGVLADANADFVLM